jgi:2-succinyl-5-enolpyruvyl-6-hydroxy-3-cyclohexene-1-carboxylate synthase
VSATGAANRRLALTLVDELVRAGLTDACLAPGSRSAPLALALAEHPGVRLHVHLDERSAAFFALGAAKASGRPAAVLCTSGTAAANLHPAVLEADHAHTPLLVLTADRPPELRGTGANQTVDQIKLYGSSVRLFCEVGPPAPATAAGADGGTAAASGAGAHSAGAWGAGADDGAAAGRYWRSLAGRAWAAALGPPAGPVHLNLAFAEPLVPDRLEGEPAPGRPGGAPWTRVSRHRQLPDPAEVEALAEAVRGTPRGLLVAGWGARLDPGAADAFTSASGWPVLADPLSGARRGPAAVSTYDSLLRLPAFAAGQRPDLVLRVGAAPTSKVLTGWLDDSVPQVMVDPEGGWADPGRAAGGRLVADPSALLEAVAAVVARRPPARGAPATSGGADQATAGRGAPPTATPGAPSTTTRASLATAGRADQAARRAWLDGWLRAEALARRAIDELLDASEEPFEGRVARDLVAALPDGATLVVGSSMPVRDVDAFAAPRQGLRLLGNRGVSGIDGFVATALGVAAATDGPVAALCGDLSFLHDASTLLEAARRPRGVVLVVCDNDGGGIFSFLPQARLPASYFETLFATPHGLDLADLAAAARLPWQRLTKASELGPALEKALAHGRTEVLLVPSSRAANLARHRELTEAVAAAYAAATITRGGGHGGRTTSGRGGRTGREHR